MEGFSSRPLFQFLTQPNVAINSITADSIFDYYMRERPNSDFSQLYHMLAKDLEEVLKSNFFNEDITRILRDINVNPFASAFSADDEGKCSLNKDNKDSNDSEEEDVDINDELRTLTDQISDTSRNNYLLAKLYEEEKQAKSKM